MARPAWLRRPIETELLPEPQEHNPMEEARTKWDELRNYAAQVAEMLRIAQAEVQRLSVENDGLRAEVQHVRDYMGDENKILAKDNRMLRAYSQNLRTRLTVIRENIEVAEQESLEYAANEANRPIEKAAPVDDEGAREMHDAIVRLNPERLPAIKMG